MVDSESGGTRILSRAIPPAEPHLQQNCFHRLFSSWHRTLQLGQIGSSYSKKREDEKRELNCIEHAREGQRAALGLSSLITLPTFVAVRSRSWLALFQSDHKRSSHSRRFAAGNHAGCVLKTKPMGHKI